MVLGGFWTNFLPFFDVLTASGEPLAPKTEKRRKLSRNETQMEAHGLLCGSLGGPRVSNSKPRGDKEDQKVPKERLYGLCKNVNITLVFVGFRRLGLPMALQMTILGCMGGTFGHMWALSRLQVPLWSAIGWLKVPLFLGRGG